MKKVRRMERRMEQCDWERRGTHGSVQLCEKPAKYFIVEMKGKKVVNWNARSCERHLKSLLREEREDIAYCKKVNPAHKHGVLRVRRLKEGDE